MFKKIISFTLTALMLISCLPVMMFSAVAAPLSASVYTEGFNDGGYYYWNYDFTKASSVAGSYSEKGGVSGTFSIDGGLKSYVKAASSWYDTIALNNTTGEISVKVKIKTDKNNPTVNIYINGTSVYSTSSHVSTTVSITVDPAADTVVCGANTYNVSVDDTLTVKVSKSQTSSNSRLYLYSLKVTQMLTAEEYTATFAGEGINEEPIETLGGFLTLPNTPAREGFVFEGWSDGTNVYSAGEEVQLTQDTTFTAIWTAGVAYHATFVGEGVEIEPIYAGADGSILLPEAPTRSGYVFAGWFDGTTTYEAGEAVTITANTEFSALWREYVATFSGTGVSADPITAVDSKVTLPAAPTRGGYVFMGWSNGTKTYSAGATVTLSADTAFTAAWQKKIYSSGVADGKAYWNYVFEDIRTYGANAELCCPNGGAVSNQETDSSYYMALGSNGSWYDYIYLNNATSTVTVSVSLYYEKSGTNTFYIGSTPVITLTEDQCTTYTRYSYTIKVDLVNSTATVGSGEPISITIPEEDSTLNRLKLRYTATKGSRVYSIEVSQAAAESSEFVGSFTGDGVNVDPITSVEGVITLPAAPEREGFIFDGWFDGTNTYSAGQTVTLTHNTTFTALWTEGEAFVATFEGENVDIDPIEASSSGKLELPDLPSRLGYTFDGWSDGTTTYPAGSTVTIVSDTTFTAVWTATGSPTYYTATFTGEGVSIAPIITYTGSITLPSPEAREGFVFAGWSNGSSTYPAGTAITLVGDSTFTAVWVEVDGSIIYQNSFSDQEDVNDAYASSGNLYSSYGRLFFPGSAWWSKKVLLDNTTGKISLSFKLLPNLQSNYNIVSINNVPVLSSYYDYDDTKYPFAHWEKSGIRFGSSAADVSDLPVNLCYKGFNNALFEAEVSMVIDPVTGDTSVKFVYDCGEEGSYSFEGNVNVGPITERTFTLKFGSGSNFRIDNLFITQAEGAAFTGSSDYVERSSFAYYANDFETSSATGGSVMLATRNYTASAVKDLSGNKALLVTAGTEYVYGMNVGSVAFPGRTVMTFDFMIPSFPENPTGSEQISILQDSQVQQNYVSINYNASNGKWYAGVGDNSGVIDSGNTTSKYEIVANKWYNVKILFGNSSSSKAYLYINNEIVGRPSSKIVGRDAGASLFYFNGMARSKASNAANYYLDNLYVSTKVDTSLVKIVGFQKSDVVDGTYKVRFVCALPNLIEGETKLKFDIVSPSNARSWTYETSTIYKTLKANYGQDEISASEYNAQGLVAVAIHGIPESIDVLDLDVVAYAVVNGATYACSSVSMNPGGAIQYSGLFDENPLAPEEKELVADPNGALAGKKVVILMGQSNMAGRGDVSSVEKIDDDRLWMYRDGKFVKMVEPVFTDKSDAGTSPGAAFAKAYAETYNEDVVLIPGAVGGTAMSAWTPGGNLYSETVKAARLAIEQGGEVIAVLWCQGESDSTSNKRAYIYRYTDMIQRLYADLHLDYETVPFIAGEMFSNIEGASDTRYKFPGATGINTYLYTLTYSKNDSKNPMVEKGVPEAYRHGSEDVPLYGVANGTFLRNIGDNTHLDAPSTRVYGYRFFNVFQTLMQADADKDGNIDYYKYADPLDLAESERTEDNVSAILDSYLIKE